jgi:hypothetical protein
MSKFKFNFKKEDLKKGVALLFAIVVSMILFTILTGVLNIALKETIFSTSVKNSNDAFYSADSAVECALLNDKTTSTVFNFGSAGGTISCFGKTILVSSNNNNFSFKIDFVDVGVGPCAVVDVKKEYDTTVDPIADPSLISTKIIAKGYSKGSSGCDQAGLKSVERVLEVTY